MPKQTPKITKMINSQFIFIVGFMASGKSTFGKRAAKELGCQFIDTDVFIAEKEKKSIPEIFSLYGEKYFRLLEKYALNDIIKMTGNFVISTGGGMSCNQPRLNKMLKNGKVIYLKIDEKSVVNRLKAAKVKRPLVANLSEEGLRKTVSDLLKKRKKYYSQAHLVVKSLEAKKFDFGEMRLAFNKNEIKNNDN